MVNSRVSQKSNSLIPLINNIHQLEIQNLREHYDIADGFCRDVQAFLEEAGIPAMNELRYAGYHLLHALTDKSEPASAQIIKAVNHCKRAAYEAAEAGILTCLQKVSQFKEDYKGVVITTCIPNWPDMLVKCDEIKDAIANSRKKGDDRGEDHKNQMAAFDTLKGFCKTIDHSREELNKTIKGDIKAQRQFVLVTLLAVLAIVVSIWFGLYPRSAASPEIPETNNPQIIVPKS